MWLEFERHEFKKFTKEVCEDVGKVSTKAEEGKNKLRSGIMKHLRVQDKVRQTIVHKWLTNKEYRRVVSDVE
jgi:hypothetical protein